MQKITEEFVDEVLDKFHKRGYPLFLQNEINMIGFCVEDHTKKE